MPTTLRDVVQGSVLHRWIAQDAIYSAASVPQQEIGAAAIQAAQAWVLSPSEKNSRDAAYAAKAANHAPAGAAYATSAAANAASTAGNAADYAASYAADGASYAADYNAQAITRATIAGDDAYSACIQRILFLQMLSDADILPEPPATALQNRGSRGLYRL